MLLHERGEGEASAWAPYIKQLPTGYDLLGMWTDAQLGELQNASLKRAAWAQRAENVAAAAAVEVLGSGAGCAGLTPEDVAWGLNTVRSRSFLGKYPEGAALPPLAAFSAAELAARGRDGAGGEEGVEPASGVNANGNEGLPSTFVIPLLDAFNHRCDAAGATKLRFRDGAFELASCRSLVPGEEATISYGRHGNDELLLRFGFCVEGNSDETVPLPGCMAELDWLISGTDRERDMLADGLDDAVRGAHLDYKARARVSHPFPSFNACLSTHVSIPQP